MSSARAHSSSTVHAMIKASHSLSSQCSHVINAVQVHCLSVGQPHQQGPF